MALSMFMSTQEFEKWIIPNLSFRVSNVKVCNFDSDLAYLFFILH